MLDRLNKTGRFHPAGLISNAAARRPLATSFVLGVVSAWSVVACGAIAAATPSVELSPLVAKSTLLGRVDGGKQIGVVLTLPLSDAQGAAEFVQHVSRPGDSLYHQYISPQEFGERFGGNAADYSMLKVWAVANGLQISQESIGRINLTVRGSVAQFQNLFKTQLSAYRAPDGDEFYSASVEPTIPSAIAAKVTSVIGLTGGKQFAPLVKIAERLGESPGDVLVGSDKTTYGAGGTGPGGTYAAKDLRTAYSIPSFGSLNKNAVVAVFEQGGYAPEDIIRYLERNNLPHRKVTPVSVDGSPFQVGNPEVELEAVLDIDMVIGINPDVAEVLVYQDEWDTFQTALLDAMTQVGDDHKAQVFSISYGQDEGLQGDSAISAENVALEQLAAEGITVTASSGDDGAYGNQTNFPYNVSDPASQPYITGVGGTTLFTDSHQMYVGEQVWNELALGHGASGGGVSSYWQIPAFQSTDIGGTYEMTANGGSATYRNVPDVAALADPLTGVGVYSRINGGWVQVGGTSVSSPIWAGYLSIINSGLGYAGLGNVGFFNPILYAGGITTYGWGTPCFYLNDILEGTNGYGAESTYPGYSSGLGYSNATGWGTISGAAFAAQIFIAGAQPGNVPGAVSSFVVEPQAASAAFKWSPATGASVYVLWLSYLGPYGWFVSQTYETKGTTLEAKNLVPGYTPYNAYVFAVDASGASYSWLSFTTKK
jgi:subtilase family serine protease